MWLTFQKSCSPYVVMENKFPVFSSVWAWWYGASHAKFHNWKMFRANGSTGFVRQSNKLQQEVGSCCGIWSQGRCIFEFIQFLSSTRFINSTALGMPSRSNGWINIAIEFNQVIFLFCFFLYMWRLSPAYFCLLVVWLVLDYRLSSLVMLIRTCDF